MSDFPIISCIIPTYNRVMLLKNAIESTIAQTFTQWELIIVDDGSTDNTEETVIKYAVSDSRIQYHKIFRKGGSAARNYGIKHAKGEFIAFLDDDDCSLPQRFETQLKAALNNNCNFIVSGYEVRIRPQMKLITTKTIELKSMGAGFPSRWLIRRKLLEKVGGFDESFPAMQDIELSYRIAEYETFSLHKDIVATLFVTNNSVSRTKLNAVKGKILLLERLANKMPPIEAAWWSFNVACCLYSHNDPVMAEKFIKMAYTYDTRAFSKMILKAIKLASILNPGFRKAYLLFLSKIYEFRYPVLVNHNIV